MYFAVQTLQMKSTGQMMWSLQSCLSLQLSPECVAAAEDVDLIVVEGMGRAIETNLYASFTCDSLKLAMVKHPEVRLAQPCIMMIYDTLLHKLA